MRRACLLLGSLMMFSAEASAADLTFEYVLHAGFGERPVSLSIAGTHATLIRQDAVTPGAAIGVFRAEIAAADQARLAAAVPDPFESPVPIARDSSYISVRMRSGPATSISVSPSTPRRSPRPQIWCAR